MIDKANTSAEEKCPKSVIDIVFKVHSYDMTDEEAKEIAQGMVYEISERMEQMKESFENAEYFEKLEIRIMPFIQPKKYPPPPTNDE